MMVSMAEFTTIDIDKAPRPPQLRNTRLAERMMEFDSYVAQVKGKNVGRLTPSEGESARGIALRVSRAAKRNGRSVQVWTVDDIVYFRTD